MTSSRKPFMLTAVFLTGALALTSCSSDSTADGGAASPAASDSATVPEIDVAAFTADFSEMAKLTDIAAQGRA